MSSGREHDSVGAVLETLADRQCRLVVRYFEDTDAETASCQDLAARLESETDCDSEQLALRLHHTVLPKLEAASFVEYDPRSRTVRVSSNELARRVLAAIDEYDDPNASQGLNR